MTRKFSKTVLDTLLKTVEVEFKVPLLGFGEIKFPVSEHAKEWWKNEKAREDLQNAIEAAEQEFIAQHKDNKVAQLLREFSLKNEEEFQRVTAELLNHLDEQKITWLMADKLGKGFEKIVSNKDLQDALNDYIPYLRDELSKIKEFREVITYFLQKQIANTTTLTYATTQEIKDLLLEQRTPKAEIQITFTPEILADVDTLPEPSDFLPPGSRMPFYRNKIFTGRETDLTDLAKVLLSPSESSKNVVVTQIAAATGMGGIGKTQLAVEFCYRYGRYFHGIHWINARDGNLEAEVAACGYEMGLPNFPQTTPEQVAATLQTWKTQPLRLIVLDNLEDPTLLSEWLPRLNGLHLLITARRQQYPPDLGIEVRQLGTLPRVDSLALLRRLSPRLIQIADAEIEPLAERLGDLPLALDLAGRYLAVRRSLSIDEYLKQLDQQGSALNHSSLKNWAKDASPTAHETNLAATFLLSWKQLGDSEIDRLAKDFFIAAGYLAPNIPIPRVVFLLLCLPMEKPKEKKALVIEKIKDNVDDAVFLLQQLGLLSENLFIHPLLKEFAKTQITNNSLLDLLAHRLGFLSNQALATGIPASFVPLRPHIESMISKGNKLKPIDKGTLLNEFGLHLEDIGEYREAKKILKRALSVFEKNYGLEHDWTGIACNNLGLIYNDTGDLINAKKMFKRGLIIQKKIYGTEHPQVAFDINNLGMVFNKMGKQEWAMTMHKRALDIWKKALGPEDSNVAIASNNLGLVYFEMGKFIDAKDLYEQALEIDQKNYGSVHPKVAIRLHNLATVFVKMDELSQAHEYALRALEMYERFLPPDHPDIKSIKGWIKTIEKKSESAMNKK